MRKLYLLGSLYVVLCAFVLLKRAPAPAVPIRPTPHPVATTQFGGTAGEWFQAMKPFCNSVEVETQQQYHPAPKTLEGAGYSAACYALAGKIEQARRVIQERAAGERPTAANIVFNIGHPVADAGDDKSAGPIMELVLEFWPDNYMALYHAGMSEYALGQPDPAKEHLHRFLDLYHENDGWRSNAVAVLGRLE
jgi:tetratricopeptide (TPR) repeat protein